LTNAFYATTKKFLCHRTFNMFQQLQCHNLYIPVFVFVAWFYYAFYVRKWEKVLVKLCPKMVRGFVFGVCCFVIERR